MKTSNKLLIAFAAALIILPILVMAYVSRVNYKVGKYSEIAEQKVEDFKTPTRDMSNVATANFTSVSMDDAKKVRIGFRYVKDAQSGIKIPNEYKDLISAKVDASGQLRLTVKEALEREHDYISIYVYGPAVKAITIKNSDATYLTAVADSIKFNVTATNSAGIGRGAHIKYLELNATAVPSVNLGRDDVTSLKLGLNNSQFRSESISYQDLSIATAGACDVELIGNYNKESKETYTIQNLSLNTLGKSEIKLINLKVANCTGSLSDETNVQMPAANIKQMFRK